MKNNDKESKPVSGKNKAAIFEAMLAKSEHVFVHINGLLEGKTHKLVVPERFKGQEQIVLQFGRNMPVPIPDIRFTSECLCGTLSFKGVPFWVCIPWNTVFAFIMADSRGMTFDECMSENIKKQLNRIDEAEKAGVTSILCAKERKPIVRRKNQPTRPDYLKVVDNKKG